MTHVRPAATFRRLATEDGGLGREAVLQYELPIAPSDFTARLRSVFTSPTHEGAAELRNLVEETYDLVNVHLPEVDVEHLRTLFRSERRPLDTLPSDRRSPAPSSSPSAGHPSWPVATPGPRARWAWRARRCRQARSARDTGRGSRRQPSPVCGYLGRRPAGWCGRRPGSPRRDSDASEDPEDPGRYFDQAVGVAPV